MVERIAKELELLEKRHRGVSYVSNGRWVLVRDFMIPTTLGWNKNLTDVCFQIPDGYPGTPPYGFYVRAGIRCESDIPASYKEPADNDPPFEGQWGFFSWIQDGWQPRGDLASGSNLCNFVRSISDRFLEGK